MVTSSNPTTKADEIALVIEDAIVSGEIPPGTVLRQEQLSAEFGVSRTPIREALRLLAALDLVSFEPHKGVRVRSLSREELRGAFLVRAELEGLAAELAVSRFDSRDLAALQEAEEHFAALTQELRTGGHSDADRRRLTADWVSSNNLFHDAILHAANIKLLERMARSSRRVFHGQVLWSVSPEIDELYRENLEQHRAILEAFIDRNSRVRALVKNHVLASGQLLDSLLERTAASQKPGLAGRVSWNND